MRTALLVLGVLGAAALSLLAVAFGHGRWPGVALGIGAVGAACAVLLLAVVPGDVWKRVRPGSLALEVSPIGQWMRSGELGHEEIVRLLDRVDRMGAHPDLPVRTEPEMARFRLMSRSEFRAVVARRLDEIEGPP